MTTLATLKSTIADDINRSDLTSQIAAAISTAIDFWQSTRFYFNESRSSTFVTVAGQKRYSSADDTDIPLFVELDGVFLEDSGSISYRLGRADPIELEQSLDSSASSGRPSEYAWFDNAFWLYPVPDAVYTVRPLGLIKKAAPASDGEASNVWMTDAFELIRCTAKVYLAGHVIMDTEMAALAQAGEQRAVARLKAETSRKLASGRIMPTQF